MTRRKNDGNRGCVSLLSNTAFVFGLLGIAWGFFLAQTRAGQQVDWSTGLSFYVGWICGIGLLFVGMILGTLSRLIRMLKGFTGGGGGGGDNKLQGLAGLLPIGGGLAGLSMLERFLGGGDDNNR